MKKTRHLCLILSIIFLLQLVCVFAVQAEATADTAVSQGCHSIDAMVPVLGTTRMFENVNSVLAYETGTDTLMYSWNADEQIYPASLVKLMTALIAVENANMTDVVTASGSVLSTIPDEAVSVELQDNEVMNVQDLLYCMLVGSANDASAVLAEHIGGSQENFVQMMNDRAMQLGCVSTLFTDPHGLSGEQYSTARDLGRIISEALKNEQFRTIFCTAEYTVPATNKSEERKLETSNSLMDPDSDLYYDARVVGGRTGSGLSGERCIATVSLANELQLVCIVIGAKSEYKDDGYTLITVGGYNETKTLLDACLTGYKPVQILYDGQALKQYNVAGGDSDLIVGPQITASTVLPADMNVSGLNYRYNDISTGFNAPVEKGSKVSEIEIWNGTVCVANADLFAMNAVKPAQVADVDGAKNTGRGVFGTVVITVTLIVCALFAVLLCLRLINVIRMRAAQKRSRRSRRDRRRSY